MRMAYKVYLYWKYFFEFFPENNPGVYRKSFTCMRWGLGLFLLFVATFIWPTPNWLSFGLLWAARVGLAWLAFGIGYLAFHFGKALIEDIRQYYSRKRHKKLDKTRFYASPMKSHIRLPAAVEVPIARIQLGEPIRRYINPDSVQRMARSLSREGLLKPIKVRPLTPAEKANDPEHDHKLVGGQIRVLAALQIGWTQIRAHILDLGPDDEAYEAISDNRHPLTIWINQYEELWEDMKKHPTLTARRAAEANDIDPSEVEALLEALDLLTPRARKRVRESILSEEEDFMELRMEPIDKHEAIALAGLTGLCHDLDLTRELVERAIEVSIKEGMQAFHIYKLVEWIKQGYYPEDYDKENNGKPLQSWKERDSAEAEWIKPADGTTLTVAPIVVSRKPAGEGEGSVGESGGREERIPTENIRESPYDQRVVQEGGLKSYVQFIHRCLRLKGLGTSRKNNYEWGARSVMAWYDPAQNHRFPLFDPGPGRIEEPVYVFYITKVGGKPLRWIAAAEVEDILRGNHIRSEPFWKKDYTEYVQAGILDRLDKPEGVWAGGSCGFVKVVYEDEKKP